MKLAVERDNLLDVLNTNRDAHRAIFEEAIEGYRKAAVEQLEEHIDRIKAGSLKEVYLRVPVPYDHTDEYERIIGLIQMSKDDEVVLTPDEYRCYVQDDWDWKNAWLISNKGYSATAAAWAKTQDQDDD